jgi:hypothetical protein
LEGHDHIDLYGRRWRLAEGKITPLDVELLAFRDGLTKEQGGLGKHVHFRRICEFLWPNFIWHKWAQKLAIALCKYDVVGVTGCANSGKSDLFSMWALVNWYCAPHDTCVLVTSTSKTDAAQRVWGHVCRRFRAANQKGLRFGKLVESLGFIKLDAKNAENAPDGSGGSSGIFLIPAGDEYKNDALKRLEGRKNNRMFLVLDELQDCSTEILDSALWNLEQNKGGTHVCAAGNAASRFDAHGRMLMPVDGWGSINVESDKWEIEVIGKRGIALHFDAEKSPNFDLPEKEWLDFLPTPDKVNKMKAASEVSDHAKAQYWRQMRGFWAEDGDDDTYIVTEILIRRHNGDEHAHWASPPTGLGGIDPSYTARGDRFIFYHMEYGQADTGLWTINFKKWYNLQRPLIENEEDFNYAMILEIKAMRDQLKLPNLNLGVDSSAGGVFHSMGRREGLDGWMGVNFGGSPSELPVMANDDRLGKDFFHTMTAELAFTTRYFLENDQVRGLDRHHVFEMCNRKFERKGRDLKVNIESKTDYKKRHGKSPDIMDAGNIGVMLCRERLGAVAGGISLAKKEAEDKSGWDHMEDILGINNLLAY